MWIYQFLAYHATRILIYIYPLIYNDLFFARKENTILLWNDGLIESEKMHYLSGRFYISYEWTSINIATFWVITLNISVFIPPANEVWGYIGFILSVRLSVGLPCVDLIFCTHVQENGYIDFSDNFYTYYVSSEDEHMEISYWLENFAPFYRLFFSVFGLRRFFNNKK